MVWSWRLVLRVGVLGAFAVAGCGGGSDDDDDSEAKKPDTGYGAAQAVPSTRTCFDFCVRAGDCAAELCNEDTKSTRYDALEDLLVSACEAQCDESLLQTKVTADQWQCFFQSSCRQTFDYDTCRAQASYYCN